MKWPFRNVRRRAGLDSLIYNGQLNRLPHILCFARAFQLRHERADDRKLLMSILK
jgi:hypothetical protein